VAKTNEHETRSKPSTESEIAERLAKYLTKEPFDYAGAYEDCGISQEEGERLRFRFASVFNQIETRHLDRLEALYFKYAEGTLNDPEGKFSPAHAKAILQMRRWNKKAEPTKNPQRDPRAVAEKMQREHDHTAAKPAGANPTFCAPGKNRGIQ
jgi:hypothetical protein